MDESSCSAPVKKEIGDMLEQLYTQVSATGATIKIGVVQFRGAVTQLPLTELNDTTKDTVTTFLGQQPGVGGSNMSAGLIAGQKMLDADTGVKDSRKYLILVSDGITYIWDDAATDAQENYGVNFAGGDSPNTPFLAGNDSWDTKYGMKYVPENWQTHLGRVAALKDKTISEKASEYVRGVDITDKPFVSYGEKDSYACTVDIALYESYLQYKQIAAKYHGYVADTGVESETATYPFGPSFMQFLAGGEIVSFADIQKDIYYLLDAGTTVVDEMGKTGDYDFDFVNDPAKLKLTVGGEPLTVTAGTAGNGETAVYNFGTLADGKYPFVLHYYKNGVENDGKEAFVWDINQPVSKFEPVQLTYSVKLANPKTEAGTYGEYDQYGANNKPGLYTNNKATLNPVDSDGKPGEPADFPKPTVSYTVEEQKVTISGEKTWVGDTEENRPASITIRLMNGKTKVAEKTVTKADGWKWSFTDLDAKKDGVAINYTIEEVPLNGYTTAVDGYNVTNTLKTVHIAGEKQWDDDLFNGLRPDTITVRLLANGKEIAREDDVKAPHWAWDFGELPAYDKNGRKITYTIQEDPVKGYTAKVDGYDVTNTLETVHIYGEKTWKNDKESSRPKSITIRLYADGKELTHMRVTKDDGWKWDFGERPKYNADGEKTVYTIKEDKVTGYTTKIDGFNVTNTKNKTPYSSSDKLMQTGQLNWPIPVLGIGGAALLAVGVYLLIQKKKGRYEG